MASIDAPEAAAGPAPWEVTGNDYLAFPCISPLDGGIHRLNVLHRGAVGLLEWASARAPESTEAPLLGPELRVDGEPAPLRGLAWEQVERWIPTFRADLGSGLRLRGTLCAPGGGDLSISGATYLLEVENRGERERSVDVALAGTWRWSLRTIGSSRPLSAANRVSRGLNSPGLVLELGGEPALAALALVVEGADARYAAAAGDGPPRELAAEDLEAPNGEPLRLRVGRTLRVAPGRRASVAFYFAVAVERDGALARVASLRHTGAAELVRLARLQLAQMTRRTRDPALGALLNRNLLFNVFFALGRALDDDRLYPVVSRSPLCPPSAVFRERDALLWSLPALILADPALAREALLRAFEQFSHRPGGHTHYLDGSLLSPAFALDHCCAYVLALDRYLRETGDETVLDEPIVGQVVEELDEFLLARLHPEILLAATEVLPSGEPADHPYVTYDNVLLWALSEALDRVWRGREEGRPANFAGAGEEVAAAIWRHCSAEIDGLRVLAWSTDLRGEVAVYDDPEGSLALLPFLGFCDAEDPLWRNTMELLHSPGYQFWLGERPYPGMASRRRPGLASLPGLCAELLGPRRDEALAVLRRLALAGGLACEAYDPDTGATAAGAHHAAAAGLLAWALWRALEA